MSNLLPQRRDKPCPTFVAYLRKMKLDTLKNPVKHDETSEDISEAEDRAFASESVVEEFIDREVTHHHKGRSAAHGPLPIVIGITGHRDLRDEDIPKIEDVLREQYKAVQKHYPSTSFILLSALADGADRVGARLALELGIRLIVVLPMPRHLYERDFHEASLVEFRELMSHAEHSFDLPIVENREPEEILSHGFPRNQQYAAVGAYLATHSTILIALWDGVPRQLFGGTSQVVRYKLEGVPEPFAPPHSKLDAPDSGPVYHIVTPRVSNPKPNGVPFALHRLYPTGYRTKGEAEQAYRDMFERMDTFNSDALNFAEELKDHRRASKESLFPSKAHKSMPAILRETLDFYSIADVLSQRFQTRTNLLQKWLLMFLFFAAAFQQLYPSTLDEQALVALYLAMFMLAYFSHAWAKRKAFQAKYLDYRALAEGLRVQFFWRLAGIKDSAADYYMRKQKSELDWIRHAVRTSMTETLADDPSADIPKTTEHERLTQVLKHWVEDQSRYFGHAAHRDHEKRQKIERWVGILFAATLGFAFVQIFISSSIPYIWLAVGTLPVLAAVMHTYTEKMAYTEHKRQYDRMSVFYHRAKVHLEELIGANNISEAQSFIAELGREALIENGDWILTHRDRPLEVPKG